jgi:hypothetical protein
MSSARMKMKKRRSQRMGWGSPSVAEARLVGSDVSMRGDRARPVGTRLAEERSSDPTPGS